MGGCVLVSFSARAACALVLSSLSHPLVVSLARNLGYREIREIAKAKGV